MKVFPEKYKYRRQWLDLMTQIEMYLELDEFVKKCPTCDYVELECFLEEYLLPSYEKDLKDGCYKRPN